MKTERLGARIALTALLIGAACAQVTCSDNTTNPPGTGGEGGNDSGPGGSGANGGSAGQGGSGGNPSCLLSGTCIDGTICTGNADCNSGLCVDGICCATACNGVCESCALPGKEGICSPYTAGQDPEMECSMNGNNAGTCSGIASCSMEHLWSRNFGGTKSDTGYSVSADASGNAIIVGRFQDTADFGGGVLQGAGVNDIVLAKYDGANGNHVWSKQFGGTNDDFGYAVATDASGNVFMTGFFLGPVDFGGGPLQGAGAFDIPLAKFDGTSGTHLWSKSLGGPNTDRGFAVIVDKGGDVFVAGQFADAADFGGGTLQSAGNDDVFVAKFHGATGAHLWSKRFGGTGQDIAYALAVDGNGNVVVAGAFGATADFGGNPFANKGGLDIFLAKYDGTNGNHLWSRSMGGTSGDLVRSVAVDPAGDVLIAGYYAQTTDLGGGPLPTAGGYDILVAKYKGATGDYVWGHRFGGKDNDLAAAIVADKDGRAVVTGYFSDNVDFGGGTLSAAGFTDDIFVAKFDGVMGKHVSSRALVGTHNGHGESLAMDPGGHLFLTGSMRNTADYGGGVLTSNGLEDVVLMKLTP